MKKILLVKTSSLGDVVHNLPVASDIRAAVPGAEIDWVVEESFVAIPRLHPAIARVLPVAMRRWRSGLLAGAVRAEIGAFVRELKAQAYDAVIDTQGLLKSAWIAWSAHGTRHGLDFASAREPLSLFYDHTHSVPWTMHAVERNRLLAAKALGYAVPATLDYGIRAPAARFAWLPQGRYAVLVHGTSARAKLWPVEHWIELGERLARRGMTCVLPWGGAAERLRAEEIARALPGAVVAPALSIEDAAGVLAGAGAVIGVDTGFAHLAVALAVPTAGLYCATDPAATGLHGGARAVNLGGVGTPPAVSDVMAVLDRLAFANHESRITNHE
jgi:heptosyltransferase-1